MSDSMWCDITVDDADRLAKFYEKVMGWEASPVDMGGYNDYVMMKADGTPAGGICHNKGVNSGIPSGWLPYFTVDDLDAAIESAESLGGARVGDIKHHGSDRFCVLRDSAEHHCAIYQKG